MASSVGYKKDTASIQQKQKQKNIKKEKVEMKIEGYEIN